MVFIGGKLLFLSLAFAIPMLVHPWHSVLLFFFIASFVQGLTLSVVFQLAHCVEEAEFPMPEVESGEMERAWAVHQVETTVDFARRNRLITWFTGGLNHQIEHHLFQDMPRNRLREVRPMVQKFCSDLGIAYEEVGFRQAYVAIARHLHDIGEPLRETDPPTAKDS